MAERVEMEKIALEQNKASYAETIRSLQERCDQLQHDNALLRAHVDQLEAERAKAIAFAQTQMAGLQAPPLATTPYGTVPSRSAGGAMMHAAGGAGGPGSPALQALRPSASGALPAGLTSVLQRGSTADLASPRSPGMLRAISVPQPGGGPGTGATNTPTGMVGVARWPSFRGMGGAATPDSHMLASPTGLVHLHGGTPSAAHPHSALHAAELAHHQQQQLHAGAQLAHHHHHAHGMDVEMAFAAGVAAATMGPPAAPAQLPPVLPSPRATLGPGAGMMMSPAMASPLRPEAHTSGGGALRAHHSLGHHDAAAASFALAAAQQQQQHLQQQLAEHHQAMLGHAAVYGAAAMHQHAAAAAGHGGPGGGSAALLHRQEQPSLAAAMTPGGSVAALQGPHRPAAAHTTAHGVLRSSSSEPGMHAPAWGAGMANESGNDLVAMGRQLGAAEQATAGQDGHGAAPLRMMAGAVHAQQQQQQHHHHPQAMYAHDGAAFALSPRGALAGGGGQERAGDGMVGGGMVGGGHHRHVQRSASALPLHAGGAAHAHAQHQQHHNNHQQHQQQQLPEQERQASMAGAVPPQAGAGAGLAGWQDGQHTAGQHLVAAAHHDAAVVKGGEVLAAACPPHSLGEDGCAAGVSGGTHPQHSSSNSTSLNHTTAGVLDAMAGIGACG